MVSNLLWTQLGLGNATPAALAGPPETPFEKQSDQLSVAPQHQVKNTRVRRSPRSTGAVRRRSSECR
jgi:hypothetical protein